jgi:CBS domain-containing protein
MKWGFDMGERGGPGGNRGVGILDGVGGRAPRLLARVSEIMTAPVKAVDPLATVARAEALAERGDFCHVPIAWEDGELVGIACLCDLWPARPHELVIQHMHVPVITISASETVLRAADLMRDRNVGCLPVLDERRRLCGIVTEGDLMRAGAIGVDQLPPSCLSCGSRHHVRAGVAGRTTSTVAYCVRCLRGAGSATGRGGGPATDPS